MQRSPDEVEESSVSRGSLLQVVINDQLHEILDEDPDDTIGPDVADIGPRNRRHEDT